MALPYFYIESIDPGASSLVLNEEVSKHVVSVLRMKPGEKIHITNGKGYLQTAALLSDHKKKTEVAILHSQFTAAPEQKTCIAISLVKNATRFEWFLEKATELGITEIIPLLCDRTEREHFRMDRMKNVLVSALVQSQQCWLPQLSEPVPLAAVLGTAQQHVKCIAHCTETEKKPLSELLQKQYKSAIVLIGPEGDFTQLEIEAAFQHQFVPVSLGNTRLRTETAGITAAALLKTFC